MVAVPLHFYSFGFLCFLLPQLSPNCHLSVIPQVGSFPQTKSWCMVLHWREGRQADFNDLTFSLCVYSMCSMWTLSHELQDQGQHTESRKEKFKLFCFVELIEFKVGGDVKPNVEHLRTTSCSNLLRTHFKGDSICFLLQADKNGPLLLQPICFNVSGDEWTKMPYDKFWLC